MTLRREVVGKLALAASALSLILSLTVTDTAGAEADPQAQPDARKTETAREPEPLAKGKPVEKTLAVGEAHAYVLKLGAGQSVTVLLEKRGVAAVATLLAPDGEKMGIFGSTASKEGTERIVFVTGSAGIYRIIVRTFFKPSPPGSYLIKFADEHAASDREKSGRTRQSCEEKKWLDRENNFIVNEALGSISQCMTAVAQKLEAKHPKAAELAAAANADVDYLIGRWHWGEFVSADYQESLVGDFRMLASAAEEPDGKRALAMMNGVVKDLKIKADHCRKSNRGLGEGVQVYVRTIQGDKEVNGLIVYYKLGIYAYKRDKMPPRGFDALSSPAHKELPASWYLIWAGKPGQPEPPLEKLQWVDVGEGKRRVDKDLLLP